LPSDEAVARFRRDIFKRKDVLFVASDKRFMLFRFWGGILVMAICLLYLVFRPARRRSRWHAYLFYFAGRRLARWALMRFAMMSALMHYCALAASAAAPRLPLRLHAL